MNLNDSINGLCYCIFKMKFEEKDHIPFENHETELKQSFDNDSIAKEIVAFLNAYEGKIYIGITK